MKLFADLFDALDRTTSTNAKIAAMTAYFRAAPPESAAWALFFLTGRRLKRLLPAALLRQWTEELTGTPPWLFDESYGAVGDLAETIALLLDDPAKGVSPSDLSFGAWLRDRVLPLGQLTESDRRAAIVGWWSQLDRRQRFLLNKVLTGELRVGVQQTLVIRALAAVSEVAPEVIAHRLMGVWTPTPEFFRRVISGEDAADDRSRPYPFCLAHPLDADPSSLGPREAWLVEWKWDGIRAQIIKRLGGIFIWSRGEELVTLRFPEIADAAMWLPDRTVLDGEILAFRGDRPLPFAVLQRRIGRQKLTPAVLQEAPVVFIAYDVLEHEGLDVRRRPLADRRELLRRIVGTVPSDRVRISESAPPLDWTDLATLRRESRDRGVEGFMLKRLESPYASGRRKGDWWKWKIEPYTVDAVLVYAQPGSGRRSSLLTDYTFAVWDEGALVPVAKAYSGLANDEIAALDRWIRQHTVERFGPVRVVEPLQVFELGFEAIGRSARHKSGIAVRFPRILRWRTDKSPEEADSLDVLRRLVRDPQRAADDPAEPERHRS